MLLTLNALQETIHMLKPEIRKKIKGKIHNHCSNVRSWTRMHNMLDVFYTFFTSKKSKNDYLGSGLMTVRSRVRNPVDALVPFRKALFRDYQLQPLYLYVLIFRVQKFNLFTKYYYY